MLINEKIINMLDQLPNEKLSLPEIQELAKTECKVNLAYGNLSGRIRQIIHETGILRKTGYVPGTNYIQYRVVPAEKRKSPSVDTKARQENLDLHKQDLDEFQIGKAVICYFDKLKEKVIRLERIEREELVPLKKKIDELQKETRNLLAENQMLRKKVAAAKTPQRNFTLGEMAKVIQ